MGKFDNATWINDKEFKKIQELPISNELILDIYIKLMKLIKVEGY